MSVITLEEARARGIPLPADDGVAQDIIDEQEAWLARKLGGPLEGDRTETFLVGYRQLGGRLGLSRHTDEVTLTDAGVAVASDDFRLIGRGSAIERIEPSATPWWNGPYVSATYEPNDLDEVRRVLFDLVALAATPAERHTSEQIGAYSYGGGGTRSMTASRAVLVDSLRPKRDALYVVAVSRRLDDRDPVINRAEPAW